MQKVETAFEYSKFKPERDIQLEWFSKKKEILTYLNPERSELLIHQIILRECGGELEKAIKCRVMEQYELYDYVNVLEEMLSKTKAGKYRKAPTFHIPLKPRNKTFYNTKDFKAGSESVNFHICSRETRLSKTFHKKDRMNEINNDTGEKTDDK
ncbi:hypothetical protein O181_030855 [Austropuccinia psidii MF-1]|uniref:Uncharacterized protein n=1 Tax=Austropuccinia psidii MF-1 TaxID=1389203 RepID=A0A9Q3H6M5_9BASI|nr:hypothetical protein [Austropuccinia psidii MF-1]